jgi:hypothetical protein
MARCLLAPFVVTAVLSLAAATATLAAPQPPRVNADAQLSVEFLKRIDEYVALHRKLEATLPKRPDHPGPADVDNHERALARLIAQSRANAKQGAILPPDTRAYLRRQIGRALAGPDGPSIRRSIMDENPGKVQLRVNGRYPDGVPVTTMPPPVLSALPKLPDDIEYRFIGERLILLDVHAHIVVDYMDEAIPR